MIKINYYIPPKDKIVKQERVIGDGKVTITQGQKEDSFNLNDVKDTSIEIETIIPDEYAKKEDIGEAVINFEMTSPSQVGTNQSFNVNQDENSTIKIPNYTGDINNINSILEALRYTYTVSISPSYAYRFYNSATTATNVTCKASKLDKTTNVNIEFDSLISKDGSTAVSMNKIQDNSYEYKEGLTNLAEYTIYSGENVIGNLSFSIRKVGHIYVGIVPSSELQSLKNSTQEWFRNNQNMYKSPSSAAVEASGVYRLNIVNGNFYTFVAVARNNTGLVNINEPKSSTYNSTVHDDFLSSVLSFSFESTLDDKNYSFYLSPELSSESISQIPIYIKF